MQLSLPFGDPSPLQLIRDRLLDVYGPQRDAQRHDPKSQFVKAMISSCTHDAVSQNEFWKLQATLAWDDLPDCAPEVIANIISAVTRPFEKAVFLVKATGIIRARYGNFDLSFLADWPVDSAFTWLDRLPGIGPKTAAVVLNFSDLRKPVFVVDRHGLRMCKRFGLLPVKADYKCGFDSLSRLVPAEWHADDLYELHWLIKMHGQKICRHDSTDCAHCVLASLCQKIQVGKADLDLAN